jgi:hypothetical protein
MGGTGGAAGTAGTSGAGGTGGVGDCTPEIQIVLDTSGSMRFDPETEELPDVGKQSKWDLLKPALLEAIASMPATMAAGMNFYPNTSGGLECIENNVAVPIDMMTAAQRTAFETALNGVTPVGGTPTHDAWVYGESLVTGNTLMGLPVVLLITDGQPTYSKDCMDPPDPPNSDALVADVGAAWTARKVHTFVVGAPGSGVNPQTMTDARPALSKIAEAGQTGPMGCVHTGPTYCHFDLTAQTGNFGQALVDALKEIVRQASDCY